MIKEKIKISKVPLEENLLEYPHAVISYDKKGGRCPLLISKRSRESYFLGGSKIWNIKIIKDDSTIAELIYDGQDNMEKERVGFIIYGKKVVVDDDKSNVKIFI
jgi:hypothetical protein